MSPIFNKVPLELRTEIYQELLTDDFDYLEPLGRNPHDKSIKKVLHTPILRVCKQAYAEASTVLYEKNTFRFECLCTCFENGGRNGFLKRCPRKGAFHRIQNVSMVCLSLRRQVQSLVSSCKKSMDGFPLVTYTLPFYLGSWLV